MTMPRDYAPHSTGARLAEEQWKRKSNYGGDGPDGHNWRAAFERSRVTQMGRGPSFAAGWDPSCATAEVAARESASSEAITLPFETKINSGRDKRHTDSYAAVASSLRNQSSARGAPAWASVRAFQKQPVGRSDGDSPTGEYAIKSLPISEANIKPTDLCLQQVKHGKLSELGPELLGKASGFRKYTRSFSAKKKPYQIPKRRSKSQCTLSNFDLVNNGAGTSGQVDIRDMGINSRLGPEGYIQDSASFLRQESTAERGSVSLFPPNKVAHMMVQDEAKTYALLSGRGNENLARLNAMSTSGHLLQQQPQYQQARHSHSIINYAGSHGRSPDLRAAEMSPSPDHRATPSSLLPGIMSSGKILPNTIANQRQQQHSSSPSHRENYHGQHIFQRHYENPTTPFDQGALDSRHQLQHHGSFGIGHPASTSTFSPLHISPQHPHHHLQSPQYLDKAHQKKEYSDNVPSHSGLAFPTSAMTPFTGSLQVAQHHGYLKLPPVDLDDLSDEERERMRVKRERNRVAAAKCRNRRRELLERLEKETERLEREQEVLRENVRRFRVQKMQLGSMLEEHETTCQKNIADDDAAEHSPEPRHNGMTMDDLPVHAAAGGLESGESSTSKNTTTSPVPMLTQA